LHSVTLDRGLDYLLLRYMRTGLGRKNWRGGGVNSEQTKTPSFKTGHSVSLAESAGFEPAQDCYTLTD